MKCWQISKSGLISSREVITTVLEMKLLIFITNICDAFISGVEKAALAKYQRPASGDRVFHRLTRTTAYSYHLINTEGQKTYKLVMLHLQNDR